MLDPGSHVHERACATAVLDALDDDEVLALEDVEDLRCVLVDVHRRPEVGRLGGLEERERTAREGRVRLEAHGEGAQVEGRALPGPEDEAARSGLHGRILLLRRPD